MATAAASPSTARAPAAPILRSLPGRGLSTIYRRRRALAALRCALDAPARLQPRAGFGRGRSVEIDRGQLGLGLDTVIECAGRDGRTTRAQAPPPGRFSIPALPFQRRASVSTIDRPRPVPGGASERERPG